MLTVAPCDTTRHHIEIDLLITDFAGNRHAHSGETADYQTSTTSPVVVEYAPDEGVLATVQWFAHGAATNETALDGESTKLVIKTYVFKKQ